MAITKEDFANAKIDESFGISDDVLVKYVQNNVYGSRWYLYWKDDPVKIKKTFDIVRQHGMSAALLVVKERAEGVGYTNNDIDGFGNHFDKPDPDPFVDLANYADATVKAANSTAYTPAFVDAGWPVNCVPQSVINNALADFKNTPTGTIKRAYVPMTAAAAWSYYYPKALKASVNGRQDYGNPIQQCTDYLNEMGAKITGSGGSGSGGSAPESKPPEVKPNTPNQNVPLQGSGGKEVSTEDIKKAIQKALDSVIALMNQRYYLRNSTIIGSKTGLLFTRYNDFLRIADGRLRESFNSIFDLLNKTIGEEVKESGEQAAANPQSDNQTVQTLLVRAQKFLKSEEVVYDESKDGNPEHGATDNGRFISWCVETIHPSLKGKNHKGIYETFKAAGYIRHEGTWDQIKKNLQKGDIVLCADNLSSDTGGKEYMIYEGDDKCIEAYPYENGQRTSAQGAPVARGIAEFKFSDRAALGCAETAILRIYQPREVEKPTPPPESGGSQPAGDVQAALKSIRDRIGKRIGSGQCYAVAAEFSGLLGGPGLGAGTKYGISGLIGNPGPAGLIGSAYAWNRYGWKVIMNPQPSQVPSGCIINFNIGGTVSESFGPNTSAFFSWTTDPTYGHTAVVESVSGNSAVILEQWGGNREYVMHNTLNLAGCTISSICIPPTK